MDCIPIENQMMANRNAFVDWQGGMMTEMTLGLLVHSHFVWETHGHLDRRSVGRIRETDFVGSHMLVLLVVYFGQNNRGGLVFFHSHPLIFSPSQTDYNCPLN